VTRPKTATGPTRLPRGTAFVLRLALLAALAALAPTFATAGEPCIVEVSVDPVRPVSGEQVLYRARVLRRRDVAAVRWAEPIAFPDVRTAWLPGRAEDTRVERRGETYLVREEHRALFPARAGRRVLPGFRLLCDLEDGRSLEVPVPPISLDVVDPPAEGRPADWSGAIGPLHAQLLADANEIPLGASVRLSLLIRGSGNLWVVEEPFADEPWPDTELFRRPAELQSEPGERLYLRRFFRMDLVPHAAGSLRIPALTLPYFDPSTGSYAAARTEPLVIHVRERRSADAEPAEPDGGEGGARTRERNAPFAAVTLGALALAAALAGVRWARSRAAVARSWRAVTAALAEADAAAENGDAAGEAAAASRAVRAAFELARNADRERERCDAMREALDRARFSRAGERPDRDAVRALIADLRGH